MDQAVTDIVKLVATLGIGGLLTQGVRSASDWQINKRKAKADVHTTLAEEETKREIADDEFELKYIERMQAWSTKLLDDMNRMRKEIVREQERRLHAEARAMQITMENDLLREQLRLPPSQRNQDILLGATSPDSADASVSSTSMPSNSPPAPVRLAPVFANNPPLIIEEPVHHHD